MPVRIPPRQNPPWPGPSESVWAAVRVTSASGMTSRILAMTYVIRFRKIFAAAPIAQGDQIAMLTNDLPLTERERQVCTLLLRGTSPKGIAEVFGLSVRTVYKHVQNIHAKLGVSSQLELVAKLTQ